MDPRELVELLQQPEGQLLEFKQEWFDLKSAREKARLARTIGAMANGLAEGQIGYVVIGVEDPNSGGRVVGVEEPPSSEQVTEILGKHLGPVPDVAVHPDVHHQGQSLSVIEVKWSPYHPHYSIRDVDGVLSTDQVLVRQGDTTRHLKPAELEMMIRAKDARLGAPNTEGPLVLGFVDLPSTRGGTASVRIHNISEQPVAGISAVVDVKRAYPKDLVYRTGCFSNVTLGPDETREFDVNLGQAHFYWPDGTPLNDQSKIWSRWYDITLHLTYRDRHGIIQSVERTVAVQ